MLLLGLCILKLSLKNVYATGSVTTLPEIISIPLTLSLVLAHASIFFLPHMEKRVISNRHGIFESSLVFSFE